MDTPFLWEDPRRKPWERLPDEPDKQFHAFTIFRDLGYERTLGEAYRRYSDKPDAPNAPTWFCKWAADWNWRERVESYDRYIDNLSCPLLALDGEGQQETDELQLETPRRDRVDLLGKEVRSHLINTAQVTREAAYPHRIGLKKAEKPSLMVLRKATNPPPKPF